MNNTKPTSTHPSNPTSTLLTELDVILDTRLATLISMNPDKAADVVAAGYHDRIKDKFPGIDPSDFQDRYAKRDESILRFAQATPMLDQVKDFVHKTHQLTLRSPFHMVPRVELNIWPYVLQDETAESLLAGLAHITESLCEIQMVSLSPEALNPALVKQRYSVMAMYDYPTWLDIHAKNGLWEKYTCPNVQLLAPLRVKDLLAPVSANVVEEFAEFERTMSPFVAVQHLPLTLFSWKFNPRKHHGGSPTDKAEPKAPTNHQDPVKDPGGLKESGPKE